MRVVAFYGGNNAMDARFVKRHEWDSLFWLIVWLYALIVVLFGFADPVHARFVLGEKQPASIALQVHVWSFSAWLVLLALQAWLVGSARMDWHRQFGLAMLPLALIMLVSAGISETDSARRAMEAGRTLNFRAVTYGMLVGFTIFVILAWRERKNPPAHKRLILMATASVMAGAHFRTWGDWWPEGWFEASFLVRLLFFWGGTMIVIAMGMSYDLITRKALHPVYKIGAPLVVAAQILTIVAFDSDWFDPLIRPLIDATSNG